MVLSVSGDSLLHRHFFGHPGVICSFYPDMCYPSGRPWSSDSKPEVAGTTPHRVGLSCGRLADSVGGGRWGCVRPELHLERTGGIRTAWLSCSIQESRSCCESVGAYHGYVSTRWFCRRGILFLQRGPPSVVSVVLQLHVNVPDEKMRRLVLCPLLSFHISPSYRR